MNIVAIATWGMHYNQKKNPWSLNSVNFWFLFCTTNCTEEWSKLNALERIKNNMTGGSYLKSIVKALI